MRGVLSLLVVFGASCTFVGGDGVERDPIDAGVDANRVDAAIDGSVDVDPFGDCLGLATDSVATSQPEDGPALELAIAAAAEGDVIELAPRTYLVDATMLVAANNVTIRGPDRNNATNTRIEATGSFVILEVQGSDFTIGNLTLAGGTRHIEVSGSATEDTTGFLANNIHSLGAESQGIRVSSYNTVNNPDQPTNRFAHDGTVFCSEFSPINNDCDDSIGVAVFEANGWRVSKNLFDDYDCVGAIAIHVRDAQAPIVDRNRIRGYADGIRVGQFTSEIQPACDVTGTDWSVLRGVICNNDLNERNRAGAVAVRLLQACETAVVHNTIYQDAAGSRALVSDRENSLVFAANNLSNRDRQENNGGSFDSGLDGTNQYVASDGAFANPPEDLLPVNGVTRIGASLSVIEGLLDGFCSKDRIGRTRDLSNPTFVGAYED